MGKIKKIKIFRKQARKAAEELLPALLKPRPKWMPRFVWRRLARLLIKLPEQW